MKNLLKILALAFLTANAHAATEFTSDFTAASTGGNGNGFYYFDEHQASQTFSGTGLFNVNQLQLSLDLIWNSLTEDIGFTFYLNDFEIGTTGYSPSDSLGSTTLDFSFAPQADIAGDWTLLMDVTSPVCQGCGAVRFGSIAPMTLTSAVPEPSVMALMFGGLGVVGFSALRRRKQNLSNA